VLNIVHGGGDVGRDLAGADIDGLLFTGSAHVGAVLARQFAATPQRILALEMGGNNPLVAWDVEDIDAAAALVVQSAYLSAGQRCTNARRLIVRASDDRLVEAVLALADRLIVGAPFDEPQPFMGPVISNAAADGLERGWAGLVATGGRVLRPLLRARADRPFLSPAAIDMTGCAPSDDELFGPVLQIIRVPDWDAAIAAANATRFGLAAGLIGGDGARFDDFWARSRAGIVNWNRPTNGASSAAPFGGGGASGNHRPSAYYAADYCAFPVASLASDAPAGTITTGLK
jgi:succinylglutamic semialdehyde dehydrogenase